MCVHYRISTVPSRPGQVLIQSLSRARYIPVMEGEHGALQAGLVEIGHVVHQSSRSLAEFNVEIRLPYREAKMVAPKMNELQGDFQSIRLIGCSDEELDRVAERWGPEQPAPNPAARPGRRRGRPARDDAA